MTTNNDIVDGSPRTRTGVSRLRRRMGSFKDDFLDKVMSIRSSSNMSNGSRSNSPKLKNRNRSGSPKRPCSPADSYDSGPENPLKDLENQVKQVQVALRYFQDVITKNKLEMLPGNGTIVLETVANIHGVLKKSYALDEQSSLIVSGLNQVYQSVARLIKLCDDLLILGEKAANQEYVAETIHSVEEAVQNLISIANDKIAERENRTAQSESSASSRCSTVSSDPSHYRASLPEILMSPNELQLLEQTTQSVIERHLSRSNYDNVDSPPPKPPHPCGSCVEESPPPLPPKKRDSNVHVTSNITAVVPTSLSLERLSLKSDNSSVASFDSASGAFRTVDASSIDGSTPRRCESFKTRVSSSSISGFVSLYNSSQSFVEQQKQQQRNVFASATAVNSSAAEEMVVTTTTRSSEATYSVVTKIVPSSVSTSTADEVPPALPAKTRKTHHNVLNREGCFSVDGGVKERVPSTDDLLINGHRSENGSPPPLPPKKKYIMAYMEMFGNCSPRSSSALLQNSETVSNYCFDESEWQQHEIITSAQSCSYHMLRSSSANSANNFFFDSSSSNSSPPSLPPKRSQLNTSITSSQSPTSTLTPSSIIISPTMLPPPVHTCIHDDKVKTPVITSPTATSTKKELANGVVYENEETMENDEPDPLAEIDVTPWLAFKRPEEDGPNVRGGHPDALIVLATKANKNEEFDPDFLYQEAFLTTYRTFIAPQQLIEKLIDRFHRFDSPSDTTRQRVARESFALLVRVISDLTIMDLDDHLVSMLMDFVYQLLCSGDLIMGKALRVKLLDKYCAKLQYNADKSLNGTLTSQNIYTRQASLLDFKSDHIAEQMTLLDAYLFTRIEIPEVLIWTQEQNEEKSPNLTRFTEHFNKMSYWARSRILEQNDAKDRERYVLKFIKIMKHLRKMNNFNSYLALLSALDSAPIMRLEWQKHITDGLKEYCALIDSSSSFRAYRQALAETQPPCIPYIGLVLQDLTFVHIGNNDYLSEGVINFSKRWQQFNIVENMKRFKKVSYNFKSHENIIAFFNNFDEFLCEEAMWQISESIKPRGKKTNVK